jgi:PAS domain S-box-containing protein
MGAWWPKDGARHPTLMRPLRILCADDDMSVLHSLERVLIASGFKVDAVGTVPEALDRISRRHYDVLLADLNIGQPGDGFTVVSAMRRVQPGASTFIITGYPDIESAIQAIRNQVDDYFTKPINIKALLETIAASRNRAAASTPLQVPLKVWEFLQRNTASICEAWLRESGQQAEFAAMPLTPQQRLDHVPGLVEGLIESACMDTLKLSDGAVESARAHGRTRHAQGYSIPQMVFEFRILQQVLSSAIQEHLLSIDLSTLVHDMFGIGESIHGALEIAIRAYQGQIPSSLQSSLASLYNSPHLGVAIADEGHIVDANDALLHMLKRNREELIDGKIDWHAMTPEEYRGLDDNGVEQLREYGACVPFEKEYMLPDGSRLPFLIGAVRLNAEPLQWSAFLVDLTEQRRLRSVERKLRDWESKHQIINRLAHEINNPLAALMFTIHLLGTHSDVGSDARELVANAEIMLQRVAAVVKQVLDESAAADS